MKIVEDSYSKWVKPNYKASDKIHSTKATLH